MSLLVESIKIMNGKVYRIGLHEERANAARFALFGYRQPIQLRKKIKIPDAFSTGLVKCRITYDHDISDISFQHYHIKHITQLKIIHSQKITYKFKYIERLELDQLYHQKGDADEIIIVNDGFVSDAYYYNLVFQKNNQYFTPKNNLLDGTQRARLLKNNKMTLKEIKPDSISEYDKIYLINALTPLGKICLTPQQITY